MSWGLAAAGFGISSALGVREASKNRKFQERMYKSRFQNTVKDLRAAGLNPILAAQGAFGGGSSPGGAQGQIPNMGSIGDTAISGKKVASENRLRKEQERQVGAATSESQARRLVALDQAKEIQQRTQTSASTQRQIEVQTEQIALGLEQARRRNEVYKDPFWGPKLTILNEMTNSASGAIPAGAVGVGGGMLIRRASEGNLQGPGGWKSAAPGLPHNRTKGEPNLGIGMGPRGTSKSKSRKKKRRR